MDPISLTVSSIVSFHKYPLVIYGLNINVDLTRRLDSIHRRGSFGRGIRVSGCSVAGEWVLFSICLGELRRAPVSMLNAPFCPLT